MNNKGLDEFLSYWLEEIVFPAVEPSTYSTYRGYIKNHIVPCLRDISLKELKPKHLQHLISHLVKKGLSSKTVRLIVVMLNGVLKCAIDHEYILNNPYEKIKLPKLEEREIIIFDKPTQKRIEQIIAEDIDKRSIGILICLYTGIRIGELCGLKWEHVCFEKCTIEIKNSLNRVVRYTNSGSVSYLLTTSPKTKKSKRTILLPKFLCQLLKNHKKQSQSEYVVSFKNGKVVEPRVMQMVFKRIVQKAGKPSATFHSLRHTFATRAIESGADVKTVSELLGHTNSMITINRYAHSLFEQKQLLMDNLDNLYRKNTNNNT